jgi:hypothetical protein
MDDSMSITWTKYIITNDKNQVMLCFDKYYKAWELPGIGYEGPVTFKSLLDSYSVFLGINYDDFRLGGLFSYFKPGRNRVIIKPYFIVHFSGYAEGNSFKDTAGTKWTDIEEAKKIIPYPTMVLILDQLTKYPENVWGGAFEEYNYIPVDSTKWKVIEPFYKLK